MTKDQTFEEILEKIIGEFYLIHCKPEIRPKFITLAEHEAWNKDHLYAIKKLVEKTKEQILAEIAARLPKENQDDEYHINYIRNKTLKEVKEALGI